MSMTRCDLHLHSDCVRRQRRVVHALLRLPGELRRPGAPVRDLQGARDVAGDADRPRHHRRAACKLIDRPDFFLSEEITGRLPRERLRRARAGLEHHARPARAIQARRSDIYRLVEYLNGAGIAHGLAHPLMGPNWKLDADVIEKLLVLFPTFESVNGLTDARIEPDLPALLERLTPERLAALAREARPARQRRHAAPQGVHGRLRRPRAPPLRDRVHGGRGGGAGPAPAIPGALPGRGGARRRRPGAPGRDGDARSTTRPTTTSRARRSTDGRTTANPFVDMMDVIAGRDRATAQPRARRSRRPATGSWPACSRARERASLELGKELDILAVPVARPTRTTRGSSAASPAWSTPSSRTRWRSCWPARRTSTSIASSPRSAISRAGWCPRRRCSSRPTTSASRSRRCAASRSSGRPARCRRAPSAWPSSAIARAGRRVDLAQAVRRPRARRFPTVGRTAGRSPTTSDHALPRVAVAHHRSRCRSVRSRQPPRARRSSTRCSGPGARA